MSAPGKDRNRRSRNRRPSGGPTRLELSLWAAAIIMIVATVAIGTSTVSPPPAELGAPEAVPEDAPRPSVLILMWDTARADRMSLYGHHRPTTPRLDAFAADALVFDYAVSPSFWTVPAHASLFTGLPVSAHRANAFNPWLRERFTTMAEWFAEHGYGTYVFSANPNLTPRTNLIQGFQVAESNRDEVWRDRATALIEAKLIERDRSTERSPDWGHKPIASAKDTGPLAQEALLTWLDGRADPSAPFFAFVNYMEVHAPRLPRMETRAQLLPPDLIELGLRTRAGFGEVMAANRRLHAFTIPQQEAMLGVYDAAMHELDDTTGDLLDALEARGLLDDTVVVVTSDHGENFGDHGLYGHNYCLYDSLIHVPLVLRYPPAVQPGRVADPVSTRDLFGTLVKLAGLPAPSEEVGAATLLEVEPDAPVYSELTAAHGARKDLPELLPDGTHHPLRRRLHAVVRGNHKYVHTSDDAHELYDRAADPHELDNLIDQQPQLASELEALQLAWRAQLPNAGRLSDDERRRRDAAAGDEAAALEALGYAEQE